MRRLSSSLSVLCGLSLAAGCGSPADALTGGPSTSGLGDGGGVGTDGGAWTADGGTLPPGLGGPDAGVVIPPMADSMGRCEVVDVDTGPVVPDMLIVLDRSGSMRQNPGTDCRMSYPLTDPRAYACLIVDCNDPAQMGGPSCGGTVAIDRWGPSVSALKSVTSTLDDQVRFGLMLFPAPGARDDCAAGSVVVDEALNTGNAIASALDGTGPGGATPTGATLLAARERIEAKARDVDVTPPPQYVLLVTDGQPTCPNGGGRRGQDSDRQLTTDAINQLRDVGVTTYVLGYDAALDPQFENALNEFARAGGTDHYRPVGDEQSLVTEIEAITKGVANCTYRLANKPADPKYVLVTLDGSPLKLDDANGWRITERDVEVVGTACGTLQDGTQHYLNVTVQCEPVVLK